MEQLTIKEIAPYLPYDLEVLYKDRFVTDLTIHTINFILKEDCKLVLRPLSDLTKEIEHNGERFVPMIKLAELFEMNTIEYGVIATNIPNPNSEWGIGYVRYEAVQKLLEWHFDIFGLIDKNLAVDFNTVNG